MRSRDNELMRQILEYIDGYYLQEMRTPSTTDIANKFNISRSSAYRYLVYLKESKDIDYADGEINTSKMSKVSKGRTTAAVVGSIPCGEAQTEEAYVEEYVSLPSSLFGKGEFYILRAKGDSMEDAGITEGDLVIIRRQHTAEIGDIVVALDDEQQNTLKRFAGFDKKGRAILEYMNEDVYPGKQIIVKELTVQGVAKHVLKSL